MIEESLYRKYTNLLLEGNRAGCGSIVRQLLSEGVEVRELYTGLFQRSMYEVGDLWERNHITVANEHLATSITETLLALAYPAVFGSERVGRKAVISCGDNEYHQMGGRMVADILEINGWDGYFLGANTPGGDLVRFIDERDPDLVGLSLSLTTHMESLLRTIDTIRSEFPNMDLVVGGQAFQRGGAESLKAVSVEYVPSLDALEQRIRSL